MSKRLRFEIEVSVSEEITKERAAEVLKAMLTDLQQDGNYYNIFVVEGVHEYDEDLLRLIDTLDTVEDGHIDAAIGAVKSLEVDE